MGDSVLEHVSEDRSNDDPVNAVVRERQPDVDCGHFAAWVVQLIVHVVVDEKEVGVAASDVLAAPCNRIPNDVNAYVVRVGLENLGQRDGVPADAASDLQDVVVWRDRGVFGELVHVASGNGVE